MRPKRTMRNSRPARVAAGALLLAAPSSAVALAAGQADAQSPLQIDVPADHLDYGSAVTIRGTAPATSAGETVLLQFARSGATRWQSLSSAHVGGDGRFRLSAPLRRTGLVRAITTGSTTPSASIATGGSSLASPARTIAVAPEFRTPEHKTEVLAGHTAHVRGKLLPGIGGRRVRLQELSHRRWHTVASARTGGRGGFDIRYRSTDATTGASGRPLRVAFGGDRLNSRQTSPAGRLIVFRESLASWYQDGGSTACGFHAGLGVANKSLPCGTKVTFRYGARTVTATVDDRGPYVGSREWDLNQNTAGALGFGGVGTVWTTS
jgi:rare lipoprotein A